MPHRGNPVDKEKECAIAAGYRCCPEPGKRRPSRQSSHLQRSNQLDKVNQPRHFLFALPAASAAASARAAEAPSPMDYLRTFGPAADPATRLNWGLLTISICVCAIIAILVLLATFRRRPPAAERGDGRVPLGPNGGGMSWIYVGVGISIAVLFASAIWTVVTLSAVAAPARPAALTIEVTGHRWWWEVKYPGDTPAQTLVTANEIHIPVGEPVLLKLDSADVIHSFWVPKLAGKTDLIPGQVNHAWLQADKAGDYRGQCAEYCGAQHAHMALHVIAEDRDRFDAWRRQQMREASGAQRGAALQGGEVFMVRCSVCHTVRGTIAAGTLGPDLTHLMSRGMIASGTLPNNTGNLNGWVANAQELKPGSLMPRMDLSPQDLHAVVTYLQTLQ